MPLALLWTNWRFNWFFLLTPIFVIWLNFQQQNPHKNQYLSHLSSENYEIYSIKSTLLKAFQYHQEHPKIVVYFSISILFSFHWNNGLIIKCGLKIMSNVFCGWKHEPSLSYVIEFEPSLNYVIELPKMWCFKNAKKFNFLFFCFWLNLLFYKLLCSGYGKQVLMMEHDHGYSIDTFYELCESRLWWKIGAQLLGERKDVERKKLYEASGNEGKGCVYEWGKAKFLSYLTMMCGVCVEFHSK